MQVHRDINNLPGFKNAVITIGTFDGMHTGHQQITNLLKQEAKNIIGESVIITFNPHPRMIVQNIKTSQKENAVKINLLNTADEKILLIENQGIDHLVIVPFTHEFSLLSAEEYIEQFLVEKFHPHTIIIGYDHRFGKQRQGNYKLLEECAEKYNYYVKEIPEHVINHTAISSTKIREAISSGDIETANKFLGYDYFFEGIVVEGDKIGRTIGYPTANIKPLEEDKLIPGNGVYAVQVILGNGLLKIGMMNIGFRPTVGGIKKMIEVNIFDFNEDIYGQRIKILLKKYLRPEQKFPGLEALKAQLAIDKANALKLLS
ncbi:MAG: bifunctional riboflavin kinase/FAD synthetase [Ginsengibacter sp.]